MNTITILMDKMSLKVSKLPYQNSKIVLAVNYMLGMIFSFFLIFFLRFVLLMTDEDKTPKCNACKQRYQFFWYLFLVRFFCVCVGVLITVVSGIDFDNSGALTSNALQECLNIIHISKLSYSNNQSLNSVFVNKLSKD